MKGMSLRRVAAMALIAAWVALPVSAQHVGGGGHMGGGHMGGGMPRANGGHLPPAPAARADHHAVPDAEVDERGRSNSLPHVSHDHWYGHDSPDDERYRLAPGAHPQFMQGGADHRWSFLRVDRGLHRFWLPGGFFFVVAPWDWWIFADWCWDCGDDYVVYPDPDHPGWYLLYNVYTGAYVHVQYLGP